MQVHNVGMIVVVDSENRLMGLVTDRDLSLRILAEGRPAATPVFEIMSEDLVTCHPDDGLRQAEDRMKSRRKQRIIVVDDEKRCVGVVAISDVAQVEDVARSGDIYGAVSSRESAASLRVP
jgi:CBS domain-containing protein